MEDDFLEVVQAIADILTKRNMSLALAESCTGGHIANAITDLPGASGFFILGVVSYSAGAKETVLGIPAADLDTFGTVSAETASAMARGVRRLSGATVALSTTGVAGPDTVEGKEKGLVYLAAACEGRLESKTLQLPGNRQQIKRAASLEALKFLRGVLDAFPEPFPDSGTDALTGYGGDSCG
jgi:nicotinamide-nucleotide amidase